MFLFLNFAVCEVVNVSWVAYCCTLSGALTQLLNHPRFPSASPLSWCPPAWHPWKSAASWRVPLASPAKLWIQWVTPVSPVGAWTTRCRSECKQTVPWSHTHSQQLQSLNVCSSPIRMWWSRYFCQTGFVCHPSSSESSQISAHLMGKCAGKRRNSHASAWRAKSRMDEIMELTVTFAVD